MWKNGGPIIMVQVENEYAGYGKANEPGDLDPGKNN
jgi:beta-galactosidase GanA